MRKRLLRYWHTLRYLRWQQFVYRLKYALPRLAPQPVGAQPVRAWGLVPPSSWPAWMPACLRSDGTLVFLNEPGLPNALDPWNDPARSKLWLYNLHYFDDVSALDAKERRAAHALWVRRWIAENRPGQGNGWEPYPTSLRIVNWIKWWSSSTDTIPADWCASLADQAHALHQRLEWHILGNHLFANAKALVFAGAWFQGERATRWLTDGLAILEREIPEQFLADGAHFELSPMYHATMSWDLCDLLLLARQTGLPVLVARVPHWSLVLERAIRWLQLMTHPDGEPAFFNDSTMGVAPRYADLLRYASQVCDAVQLAASASLPAVWHGRDSGYCRLAIGPAVALLDVARIGPDYLPGHAHADTLSFELSLHGHRLLVNSGTSVYGDAPERLRQRATEAHNTVVVDGVDSSEVWGGFRVARRARPVQVLVEPGAALVRVSAAHDGYRRLLGRNLHWRRWSLGEAGLQVEDTVEGAYASACAFFHLHPGVQIVSANLDANALELRSADGQRIRVAVEGGSLVVGASTWHPGFGRSEATQCLVVQFAGKGISTTFQWGNAV
jgi:uncharacterized heparinase superfamily protein